jgi:hypothetical protein
MDIAEFADNHRFKTRVDEDGTKIIPGKLGHIYEWGDEDEAMLYGVVVIPKPPRKQYWGFTKRTLAEAGFCIVQDGDGEGAATFDPTNEKQVKAAKRAAGVKSRRVMSPEHAEAARNRLSSLRRMAGAALGTAEDKKQGNRP